MANPTYNMVNIVASVRFNIKNKIDLKNLAKMNKNMTYNPDTFPGLILRLHDLKSTILIFSTGKLVLTGFRKEQDAEPITQAVLQIIEQAGTVITSKPEIKIQNIVTAGDLNLKLDVDLIAISLEHVIYEPEVFPGLIHRMQDPKVVFLLFTSGKFVCVGAKSETDVKRAIQQLQQEIQDLDLMT